MCSYKYICYSTALTEGGLMKQSNNKKSRDVTAFLYERLSRDDNLEGESYSIGNHDVMYRGWITPKNITS